MSEIQLYTLPYIGLLDVRTCTSTIGRPAFANTGPAEVGDKGRPPRKTQGRPLVVGGHPSVHSCMANAGAVRGGRHLSARVWRMQGLFAADAPPSARVWQTQGLSTADAAPAVRWTHLVLGSCSQRSPGWSSYRAGARGPLGKRPGGCNCVRHLCGDRSNPCGHSTVGF